MSDERKFEQTNRDLMAEYDESKLDRIGKPIGVEEHNVGKPDVGEVETAKKNHTLGDMSRDYEFFTTGVIHATTIFDRDPLAEFNKLHPTDINDALPLIIDYASPFFSGLGVCLVAGYPVNLDHRLYAIARDRWSLLRDVVLGIAMMHRETDFYARIGCYEINIVDQFALKKMTVVTKLPMVPITVFGVSSNKSFNYIEDRSYPELPTLVRQPPKDDMQLEGSRVLGPPPSPETLLPNYK